MSRLLPALVLPVVLLSVSSADGAEMVPLRGLRAEVAALLMQGRAGGALPIAAAVFPRPGDSESSGAQLRFVVELEAPPPAAEHPPFEVYAYAVDEAGEVVAHFAATLAGWATDSEGLKVSGSLAAGSGGVSVRFLAWDPETRRYGMAVRRVEAEEPAGPPRVAEECAGWSTAGVEAAGLLGLSVRPVLVSGESRRLTLDAALPAGDYRVRLARQAAAAEPGELVAASATDGGELEFVVPDLPSGVYQLSVVEGGSRASASIESWLVPRLPAGADDCRRSWPRVLREARAGSTDEPPPERSPKPGTARLARRLASAYRGLLGRLATSGDLGSAAAELAALEAPLVASDPSRFRMLQVTELKAAAALAARDPRCLLPLVSLHAEVYEVHHAAGRFALATHSRRLAAAIAELAVEHLAAADDRALIAVALTDLAHMLETRQAFLRAQRLLERALSLDQAQEAARLLLAVSYERRGRYDDARRQLQTLVAANSAHHEARIRLAVLLRRIGQPKEAEPLLRAVIAERPSGWLLSLGYQSLAQLLIRQARLTEAVATLEEAGERLPNDQAIRVLLAFALDRSGERQAVRETLAALPSAEAATSPRYRYSHEPAVALGLLREQLRQSITVRLPILAGVLGVEGAGGEAP